MTTKERIGERLKLKPELHSKLVSMTALNLPEQAICAAYMNWSTEKTSHDRFCIMLSNTEDWQKEYGMKACNYLLRTMIATGQPT